FVRFPKVEQLLARGENKASAKVGREGLQVDVRALPRESFGAALQYFTGSKDHNVAVRTRAVKMGFKLSEYGLYRSADETKVAGETEAGVYEALGLRWIPPELRENLGEIERAAEVRELTRNGLGLRVFSGLECDILKDGAMDLSHDALAELDLVIGSVHSHMNMESAEMTDRLLHALECPSLRVLGHPTGRILLHRDAFPFDFKR